MKEKQIEILSRTNEENEIINILHNFIDTNENVFSFPFLNEKNKRALLWTAIFQHLQDNKLMSLHKYCLKSLRILSRDKADLDNLICEAWISTLIEKAGLRNFTFSDECPNQCPDEWPNECPVVPDELYLELINFAEICDAVEALKCLCNLTFQSKVARALCAQASIGQGLVGRLRCYSKIGHKPLEVDLMLFDMKLFFILTAYKQDINLNIIEEQVLDYLIFFSYNIQMYQTKVADDENDLGSSNNGKINKIFFLEDNYQALICEILKLMFNLMVQTGPGEPVPEIELNMFLKLIPSVNELLYARTTSEEKLMELRCNVANLMTLAHPNYYRVLSMRLPVGKSAFHMYGEYNMDPLHALIELLEYRLNITTSTENQYENLSPILTVLVKSARCCSIQRKYLRQVVLPPLRDVSCPPEQGKTLRNQLCKLLTSHISPVRDLVAEFLFILCREKVGRMVKYTGFGNAAGHLAQKGLLSGERSRKYSSSSDDSDTEEYREAQPNIDPVVGCTRPPRTNPFEGMTEEQKEYEAMKLVNLFDKMVTDGVMKPARIGPDGRPQAVEHVLELMENPPKTPPS